MSNFAKNLSCLYPSMEVMHQTWSEFLKAFLYKLQAIIIPPITYEMEKGIPIIRTELP